MKANSLQELYIEQLRDLYDAEHQIIKALPKLIDAAQSDRLKDALREHLEVTKEQASRIEQIFESRGEKAHAERCKGMQGVIQEGDELVKGIKDANVRDAAIIASAQRVEHYEMAGYGTARTYADLLEENEASQLLQQTLDEEKEADETLTDLAEEINAEAETESSTEETDERRSTSTTGRQSRSRKSRAA
jgi:ferritin-like metal-binding protein YciE